ncbi:peptidylprolyl isomerase [Mariprofundus erugo]|uniref:peptidylprolyl isomerase n=1 Tax=Mariprofundus erugo TaxID=2528639 RepID=UPI0010FF0ED4|nr:peptidylprolyl isomerase [Mariprofundus erugo]TLS77605.1 peptidylprolyl isomerase [Mariprofundus erugo]
MQLITFLAGLLLLIAPARAEELDSIAAVVNNEAITCSEVEQDAQTMLEQLRQSGSTFLPAAADLSQRSLDGSIVKTLELQEARKLELSVSDEELDDAIKNVASSNGLLPDQLKDALASQGMDFDDYRNNLRDQMLINKVVNIAVSSKIQVSEESILEYYRKYLAVPKPRREVEVAQIFLSLPAEPTPAQLSAVRQKARSIRAQLMAGKDFGQMVAIYSESPDRQQQGVMGWFMQGGVAQRFSSVLELPKGAVSEPIRSPSGFHIMKVVDERWKDPESNAESYDEIHARHILLKVPSFADEATKKKVRQRAEALARDLSGSTDAQFAARAKEDSQGPSAERGGDLGWFKKGAMVPEFEKAAFALKAGETSGVVQSPFGFHIIRIVARRHIDPNSLEAHRDQIQQILSSVETQEQMPRWIASLRASASIDRHNCPGFSAAVLAPADDEAAALEIQFNEAIRSTLQGWTRAWEDGDVDSYFSYYSDHFNAGKGFASLAAWKAERTAAMAARLPVRISISDLKLTRLDETNARVEFTQNYRSAGAERRDLKLLLLKKEGDSWKIVREMAAVPAK